MLGFDYCERKKYSAGTSYDAFQENMQYLEIDLIVLILNCKLSVQPQKSTVAFLFFIFFFLQYPVF